MIDWREHLTSDPKVCGGQLCAKGTRVLVTVVLDNLAEGLGREEILRSYPTLEPIHIDAALVLWPAITVTYASREFMQQGAAARE